mmetsp:Transcript_14803/g.29581  ORF Transcript_14803/g.29581 Transcript_14803/m.29581 type:complete len:96 (+) Transcript_14803:58-345(+)
MRLSYTILILIMFVFTLERVLCDQTYRRLKRNKKRQKNKSYIRKTGKDFRSSVTVDFRQDVSNTENSDRNIYRYVSLTLNSEDHTSTLSPIPAPS